MRTVVIVGAGASRAEAESQGAKAKDRPPLDTDFFAVAERHPLQTHRDRVAQFVRRTFGLNCFAAPRPRMEEVFSLIYTSTLGTPLPPDAEAAFASLCRIYATVVSETTNTIAPRPTGPLCRLLNRVVGDGPTTVVTFNQDILIEKALRVLAGSSPGIRWYPNSGYGMQFENYTTPSGNPGSGTLFELDASTNPSNPLVLKPHGSLNWFASTKSNQLVPSRMPSKQKIKCTRRLTLSSDMTYSQPTKSGKGRKQWYTWPIIVPPVLEKGAFLGQALAPVWNSAWTALQSAERVIVYGYSFPQADAQSRAFFLRAATSMKARPTLVTINLDANASFRAVEIFRPTVSLTCARVVEYLRDSGKVALA